VEPGTIQSLAATLRVFIDQREGRRNCGLWTAPDTPQGLAARQPNTKLASSIFSVQRSLRANSKARSNDRNSTQPSN